MLSRHLERKRTVRLLPQKHRISVEKWKTLYEDGAPLDCAEDRIILYHIEHIWKEEARYGKTEDLKAWLDKMSEWYEFFTSNSNWGG